MDRTQDRRQNQGQDRRHVSDRLDLAQRDLDRLDRRTVCRLLAGAVLGIFHAEPVLFAAEPAPATVTWQTLQTLDLNASAAAQKGAIVQFAGKRVSIPGFMVPLEDDLDVVTEFLLVPYAGACIHVPPPPPNQIVYVKMVKSTKLHVTFTDPISVTGTLHISTVQSPYGAVSYDLAGESVAAYQAE